jgi:hypothetical protein
MRLEKGRSMAREGLFYVYRLIDPRDESVFYIGKGKGKRAYMHQKNAKKGRIENVEKHRKIKDIILSGHNVLVDIVQTFDKECDALKLEKDLITANKENITNIANGNKSNSEIISEMASHLLNNLLTVEQMNEHSHKDQISAIVSVFGSVENYDNFVRGVLIGLIQK